MNRQHAPVAPPLGLLELDPAGVVVRYDPTAGVSRRRESVVGRDFFTEVMPAEQVYDLRARFLAFMAAGHSQERFAQSVPGDGGALRVQVVLAARSEPGAGGRERLALVRITPAWGINTDWLFGRGSTCA
jgi:hypothetical protein